MSSNLTDYVVEYVWSHDKYIYTPFLILGQPSEIVRQIHLFRFGVNSMVTFVTSENVVIRTNGTGHELFHFTEVSG